MHTSKDRSNAAQQLAASGQSPRLTQAAGATASPLAQLHVHVDGGSTEKLLLPLPFLSPHVSFSICNGFQFFRLSSSSFSLALIHINGL